MRFFYGEGNDLGNVTAYKTHSFEELCREVSKSIVLQYTREDFFALPEKLPHKKGEPLPEDQNTVKRVRYITPGAFKASPCNRTHENVVRCNLIALDIDDAKEAKRLLEQRWADVLGDLGFIVWHTVRSTPAAPRLRVVVNAEGLLPAMYQLAARTIAEMIGMTTVTTQVVFHAVQPMFLPTIFLNSTSSPIVASNPKGEAFTSGDIVADDESSMVDSLPKTSSDALADLEYLRMPMEGVTMADAASALDSLDPDMPMQQWIEIAAGLKHQFDNSEAYQLWDNWSKKGKKYVDASETKYRWGSLKAQPTDRAPITIRSVFKQAQARGWSNPTLASRQHADTLAWIKHPSRNTEELLDQGAKRIAKVGPMIGALEKKVLMVSLKETISARGMSIGLPDIKKAVRELELEAARTTGIPPWAKGLCYITSLNIFYRMSVMRKFSPDVLDLMYATPAIGEDKAMRPRDYLMQIVSIPVVESLRYDPTRGTKRFFSEDNIPFVNTYRPNYAPPEPERADEAGEIFHEHIRNLVAEEDYQTTLIDFLAYHVQQPGKKIRWAVLLQSAQGAGKTFLAVAMRAVLGRGNAKKLSAGNVIESQYNDWASGSQLVIMEEIRVVGHNRHAVMDKLKPLISDDEISYHKKYEDHSTVPNVSNYLLFTNHHDALAVNDDDRRYFVLASPIQRPEHIKALGGSRYFSRLFNMVRDNAGGLRSWLEQWKISPDFDPEGRAPITPYLQDLADNAASPLASAVKNCIDDEPHPLVRRDLVSVGCLRGALDSSHLPDFSDQALASVLRELGWTKYSRLLIDGSKHQIWVKKQFDQDVRAVAESRLLFL